MENLFPAEFIWMERLISFAIVLQTIELLQIRKSFLTGGIWDWKTLEREFLRLAPPLRLFLNTVMGDREFFILLVLRLTTAVIAPFAECSVLWAFLWLSTLLITVRWRGTFNGGSDYMTLIVLAALFLGRALGPSHPRWIAIALGYVAFQLCLSYFIAGYAKLKRKAWRDGTALTGFLSSDYYSGSASLHASQLKTHQSLAKFASWGLLLFECLFPIAFLNPQLCLVMITLAVLFQLGNAYAFGLNRFVWAWGAAYPALYWCCLYLARPAQLSP